MAAKTYPVYDGDGGTAVPARPSLDDLGGADLEDDQEYPPDPETDPTAAAWNQRARVHSAHAKVVPVMLLSVRFVAGAPTVEDFSSTSSTLVAGDLVITDNGDGDTSVAVPADTLPLPIAKPMLSIWEDVEIDRQRAVYVSATEVRVKTKLGAVGTDAGFQLAWF